MWKKIQYICLAIALCITTVNVDFVKAEEPLALELYLTQVGQEGNSLIASLTDYELAENEKIWAGVYYSLDNVNFQKETIQDVYWFEDGRKLNRPCLLHNHEVLSKYLEGTIDTLYVKLEVYSSLGFSKWTETAVLKKPVSGENVMSIKEIYAGIPANMMMGNFRNRYAQYHMTVTENENGYKDLLPQTLPVAFSLVPEQKLPYGDNMVDVVLPYDVFWEESAEKENTYIAVRMQNRIKEDYFFVGGNQNFCIEKSLFAIDPLEELAMMRMNNWYCTVHPVPKGYVTELFLKEDSDIGILSVELPLKPTGMTRIEIEVSTDGEASWHMVNTIKVDENPVDYMPKEEGYSVCILSKEKVEGLLSEGTGTFHVRLKIVNGALGNQYPLEGTEGDTYTYSQSAVWTGSYVELPPKEDDENKEDGTDKDTDDFSPGNEGNENGGSGGNNGNVGSDNSGESDGQRPGVDTSPEDEDTRIPSGNPDMQPDDETSGGDEVTPPPSDDTSNGEHVDAQPPSDDASNGESADIQSPSNDTSNGEHTSTQPPLDDASNGEHADAQPPSDGTSNEEHADAQPPSNDASNGEHADTQPPSDDTSNGEHTDTQSPSDDDITAQKPPINSNEEANETDKNSQKPPINSNEEVNGTDTTGQKLPTNSDDMESEDSTSTQESTEDIESHASNETQDDEDSTEFSQTSEDKTTGSRNENITDTAIIFGIAAAGCAAGAAVIKLGILPRLLEWITKRKHR